MEAEKLALWLGLGTRMAVRASMADRGEDRKNGPFRARPAALEALMWQHDDAPVHILG
jgi:hypothetical protein